MMEHHYKESLHLLHTIPTYVVMDVSWLSNYNLKCSNFLSFTPKVLLSLIISPEVGDSYLNHKEYILELFADSPEYNQVFPVGGVNSAGVYEIDILEAMSDVIDEITTVFYTNLDEYISKIGDPYIYVFKEWVGANSVLMVMDRTGFP